MGTGIEAHIEVKPSYGLGDDEVARMLRDGFENAHADVAARALAEQQVEAARLIEAAGSALAVDGDLLDPAERSVIDDALAVLARVSGGKDIAEIRKAVEALGRVTDDFAARRMNRSVHKALAGRRVESL
jgi:molecular chaperone HscA